MGNRMTLHTMLSEALPETVALYFKPPPKEQMEFPCVLYKRETITTRKANNKVYSKNTKFTITLMDLDPDSEFVDTIVELPLTEHDRSYEKDNITHDVFTIFV